MKHPIDNEKFIQKYMYFGKISKSNLFPLVQGFLSAIILWVLGGYYYYLIIQSLSEQKSLSLWRPVKVIYNVGGENAVLGVFTLLGLGALYFAWRNYKIKTQPLPKEEYNSDEQDFIMQDENPYQVTEENIRELEKQIGFNLPQDYRDFLLRYNGGRPVAGVFNDKIEICFFYRLITNDWGELLSGMFEEVPSYVNGLPIASVFEGGVLVLSPEGEIFFFDLEIFGDEDGEFLPETENKPEYIAKSFTELIKSLY